MSWTSWRPPVAADSGQRPGRCPQCGRPCAPDMLQPTASLPAAVRARLRQPEEAWACDACRATLHREGHITPAALAKAQGAPPEVVARLEVKYGRPT